MLQADKQPESLDSELVFSQAQAGEGQDVLKVLWCWKWLAMLGAVLGLIVGYLLFTRQEPTYESRALVQVVYPSTEAAGIETLEGPDGTRPSRLDESRIIMSARVIDTAIEIGNLATEEQFAGMSPAAIREWILHGKRLTVEPAGRDSSTALIEVSFVCNDAKLSHVLVDSIIAGYDNYLEQEYRNLGNEVVRVVTQAQDKLRESYESLSNKHAAFRKDAPMIWLGDEARNQFAENTVEINASINQIEIEIRKLRATIDHIAEVRSQGRSADAILMMLSSDATLRELLMVGDQETLEPTAVDDELAKASEALPFSSAERRAELMELQIKEQELLDSVGEEHPSVASVKRRIELLERQIAAIADSERRLEAANAAAQASKVEVVDMTPDEKLTLWRNSLGERLVALRKQEGLLRELANENESRSKELQEYLTQNRLLNSELASVQQILDGFTNTLNRIQILPESSRRTLETLTPADEGSFYGPSLAPYCLGGSLAGFLCIAVVALLIDWLDQSFRGPNEISSTLGLPILGHVPQMNLNGRRKANSAADQVLCTVTGDYRDANESYRSIRTGLYFSDTADQTRIIQVTSPAPGDGKSTLAANLSVSIAQSGRSVLLIDADLRRPRVAKLFGMTQTNGIPDVILGSIGLQAAIRRTSVEGLSVLATSMPMSNPSEVVSHQRFQDILDEARQLFDYVIIDTPPVLAVADACAVAARVDGVLLTFRLRRDTKVTSTEASSLLQSVGARVLGVVVNGVTGREGYQYGYHNYGYGSESNSAQANLLPKPVVDPDDSTVVIEDERPVSHPVHTS